MVWETATASAPAPAAIRVDWVDYAKGICIILVVMMHSTLGVEKALGETGWISQFIAWAKPFRMPDFFLISGLFLARRLAAPWPRYADVKIIHFAYFYVLWMTIQFLFKGPGLMADAGPAEVLRQYALGLVEPFGTLWFIYLLAVFFAVTKTLRHVPPLVMLAGAALLESFRIHTGWTLVDEFAARYVYFYAGYWLADHVFALAEVFGRQPLRRLLSGLGIWAAAEALLVFTGAAALPGVSLVLGFAGALAVIASATLFARLPAAWPLRYLGANSIVVYLAFFLFMAASRSVLLKMVPELGVDAIAALVTIAGIAGPVLLHISVGKTPLRFLFQRPAWAKLETWRRRWHSAPHDQPQIFRQAEAG